MKPHKLARCVALSPVLVIALALIGCSDNSGHTATPDEKQASTLSNPMGYGGNTDKVDISGGDLKTLDKKAMKRDVDSVFNP